MTAPGFNRRNVHLPDWAELQPVLRRNLEAHGDFMRWREALDSLPNAGKTTVTLGDTVTIDGRLSATDRARLCNSLQALHPWRKGPFSLFGVDIDSEWRSDLKWRRVAPHIDLRGLRVLDIGCGNGYYGWRMREAGAELVVGIDPTVIYCMQHLAINRYVQDDRNEVLPTTFEALPPTLTAGRFDAAFSMGVIYHRRDPPAHLRGLLRCLVPGGLAIIESLVTAGPATLIPPGRYARMRNVWHVPTEARLLEWMAASGFHDIRLVDSTVTTTREQRSTSWMRFDSLAGALDPGDSALTVEGHPAPRRCVAIARAPA